tara:strand:- start:43005 stop:43187 length:183 start_codon:yes stop_codon:yes gene_type:complete
MLSLKKLTLNTLSGKISLISKLLFLNKNTIKEATIDLYNLPAKNKQNYLSLLSKGGFWMS